jgi:hypothetical protein
MNKGLEMAAKKKKKVLLVIVSIVVILIVLRIALQPILLKKANKFLATFSPVYSVHIDKISLSIFTGGYQFKKIIAELKEDKKKFLEIEGIGVSMAWREIFKGRLVTDIEVTGVKFLVIKDIKKLQPPKTEEKSKAKKQLFPIDIERFDLKDSSITFEGYESMDEKNYLTINDINGRMTNLTPNEKNPLSYFNLKANMLDPDATLKLAGALNMIKKPIVWDLDAEIRNFHLNLMNPYFKKHLPLTFTKGTLDLYSEAQSKEGTVKGYVKPFIRELDVVANKEKFKSAKHFGFEAITAIANLVLREAKTKSVATKVDFTYDKKLNFDSGKVLSKTLKHAFNQQISPGIDDQYQLK